MSWYLYDYLFGDNNSLILIFNIFVLTIITIKTWSQKAHFFAMNLKQQGNSKYTYFQTVWSRDSTGLDTEVGRPDRSVSISDFAEGHKIFDSVLLTMASLDNEPKPTEEVTTDT